MRRCIFCDAEIPSGAPPEHVLPKWLRKFLEKGEFYTQLPGTFQATYESPPEPWGKWRQEISRHPTITVDTVCADCNHHWMSDLETWTSPILTPMIEGKSRGLDIAAQVLVSRWATKTAMVCDQLVPSVDRHYTADECRWMPHQAVPPPDTTVRLGHYTGHAWAFIDVKHISLFRGSPDPSNLKVGSSADAFRTAMAIGKLVIEIAVRRPEGDLTIEGVDLDDILMPVWPSTETRSWPPRLGQNDKALQSFFYPDEAD
jgi:hypothetical protein